MIRDTTSACLDWSALHPFDTHKYGRAWKLLRKEVGPLLARNHLPVPRAVTHDELLGVHSKRYLDSLRRSAVVADAINVPSARYLPAWILEWCVLRPMRWAVMGSLLAAQAALAEGIAVNLSGGYHHAKPDSGEGFCLYSDIAFVVSQLRKNGGARGGRKDGVYRSGRSPGKRCQPSVHEGHPHLPVRYV